MQLNNALKDFDTFWLSRAHSTSFRTVKCRDNRTDHNDFQGSTTSLDHGHFQINTCSYGSRSFSCMVTVLSRNCEYVFLFSTCYKHFIKMCSWIVVLKSIGSFIRFYRIDKNITGLPFTKFNDRITNTCMIKHVMNSRLKYFLLNWPSARTIFFSGARPN